MSDEAVDLYIKKKGCKTEADVKNAIKACGLDPTKGRGKAALERWKKKNPPKNPVNTVTQIATPYELGPKQEHKPGDPAPGGPDKPVKPTIPVDCTEYPFRTVKGTNITSLSSIKMYPGEHLRLEMSMSGSPKTRYDSPSYQLVQAKIFEFNFVNKFIANDSLALANFYGITKSFQEKALDYGSKGLTIYSAVSTLLKGVAAGSVSAIGGVYTAGLGTLFWLASSKEAEAKEKEYLNQLAIIADAAEANKNKGTNLLKFMQVETTTIDSSGSNVTGSWKEMKYYSFARHGIFTDSTSTIVNISKLKELFKTVTIEALYKY